MVNDKKPMILLWKECSDNIAHVINESKLPAFVLESILKDMLSKVQKAMQAEYNASLSYYKQICSENENKDE